MDLAVAHPDALIPILHPRCAHSRNRLGVDPKGDEGGRGVRGEGQGSELHLEDGPNGSLGQTGNLRRRQTGREKSCQHCGDERMRNSVLT